MDIDSQKCPDCGKPFQSPTGAEAVCECGQSSPHQPTQPEGGIVYLLPCPKCGDQKHAQASQIGKTEKCQCGYEFRYTIVLTPTSPVCKSVYARLAEWWSSVLAPRASGLSPSPQQKMKSPPSKTSLDLPTDSFTAGEVALATPPSPRQKNKSTTQNNPVDRPKGQGFNDLYRAPKDLYKLYGRGRILRDASLWVTGNERSEYSAVDLRLSIADAAPGHPTNCPNATPACIAACLNGPYANATRYPGVQEGKIHLTNYLRTQRNKFITQLCDELEDHQRKLGYPYRVLVATLNASSDIAWETKEWGNIPQRFPEIIFVDDTRIPERLVGLPANYHLALSWSEDPAHQRVCADMLAAGQVISMVFTPRNAENINSLRRQLPQRHVVAGHSYKVIDGSSLDHLKAGAGIIKGYRLKAETDAARKEIIASGFAVLFD